MNRLREKNAHHDLKVFIAVKFMYGLRLLSVTYFGSLNYPFTRYAAYNAVALLIINFVIVAVGWAVGQGVGESFDPFASMESAITFILGTVVVYGLVRIYVVKAFSSKE